VLIVASGPRSPATNGTSLVVTAVRPRASVAFSAIVVGPPNSHRMPPPLGSAAPNEPSPSRSTRAWTLDGPETA
jgi:hypothetical protein